MDDIRDHAPDSKVRSLAHFQRGKLRILGTQQQLALLTAAAQLVAPGGRLVSSSCSLEPEENEGVVEVFLRACGGRLALEQSRHSRPWETGCDGAGAFLVRRT